MQQYFFILSEGQYEYYRVHSHSELFHSGIPSYETYSDAKKEIDTLRIMYPEKKWKIYELFTFLNEVKELEHE